MTDRRRFLGTIAACGSAGLVVAVTAPVAALLAEPGRETGSAGGAWLRVARVDMVPTDRPLKASVIGPKVDAWSRAPDQRLGAVWLFRDDDQHVRAYSAACPHLGCPVDFTDGRFACPCHESFFDLQGRRTEGPSPRGLDPLDVRLEEGWIVVRFQRFRLGTATRSPV